MRAYILGTVAHEVIHRYEQQMDQAVFGEYYEIMKEELAPGGQSYLTEYVRKHKEAYKSSEKILFKEDLAESVRLYTTNPEYLEKNFPRRFAFIKKIFPFIKQGGVIEALRALRV